MQRNRIIYAVWIFIVILLGLASRSHTPLVPSIIKEYAGDTLWALAAYLMVGFLFTRLSIWKVAATAGLFSLVIEVSQLYHAPWIDYLRHLRLGGLVLGFGFLWSDLVCYLAGIGIGVLSEWSWKNQGFFSRHSHVNPPK